MMAIPDYQTVMLPLLRFLEDEREHNIGEVVDSLAEDFNLSAEERQQLLGSGQQTVIRNRAGWARTYLKKAGLIASTRRGFFRITESGQKVLASKPERIDVKYLERFPQFVAFRELRHERSDEPAITASTSSRLRKNSFCPLSPSRILRFETTLNSHAGCAKRPSSKAAASKEANRTICRTLSL
jgi:restriction system protein